MKFHSVAEKGELMIKKRHAPHLERRAVSISEPRLDGLIKWNWWWWGWCLSFSISNQPIKTQKLSFETRNQIN